MVTASTLFLAAATAFAALTGCGSEAGAGQVATAGGAAEAVVSAGPSVASDPDERRLQLTDCLRDQGIDVPDAGAGGQSGLGGALQDADQDELSEAMEACEPYVGAAGAENTLSPDDREQFLAYISCLREQGIDIADPDPTTGRPQTEDLQRFRNPDDDMKRAQQACEDQQPEGLGGGGTQ